MHNLDNNWISFYYFLYTERKIFFISIRIHTLLIFLIKLQIDIYNTEVSRKAHPSSLYPSIFFDEVFSLCEEKDWQIIEKLQKEIAAIQLIRTPQNHKSNISSISESVRQIEQKYEECLQNYLTNPMNSEAQNIAIIRLRNKIELCHKTIEKEKEAFLSDKGENTVSFNFNRQNQFTDIFLTGISIPILLEALKWEVNEIEDFILALKEKPIMCFITGAFLITLFYRILKYLKNKRSMLRGMNQTILYDKAELMLCSFECALKNIDN